MEEIVDEGLVHDALSLQRRRSEAARGLGDVSNPERCQKKPVQCRELLSDKQTLSIQGFLLR
jgi:hypothetical protein